MKSVLVTGAAKGLGAAIADAFDAAGYKVIITYLNTKPSGKYESYQVDGRSSCEVNELANKIACPDILINNAGISQVKQIQDITDDDWKNMIETNLSSAFYFARAFAPAMIERKSGMIINVSSIWGMEPASCETHYAASKAGLIGFTKSLDAELSPSGISVKYIAPGAIETDMIAHYSAEDRKVIEAELGKIKSPQQVAMEILDMVLPGGIEPPTKL